MDRFRKFGGPLVRMCLGVLIIVITAASMAGMLALPNPQFPSERPADTVEHTIDSLTAISDLSQAVHTSPAP